MKATRASITTSGCPCIMCGHRLSAGVIGGWLLRWLASTLAVVVFEGDFLLASATPFRHDGGAQRASGLTAGGISPNPDGG